MDLVQFLRAEAREADSIDAEYVKRISTMPQSMLEHERQTLETSLGDVRATSEQLAATHLHDFVDARATVAQLGDLMRTLSQTSVAAIELSLATPRPSERAYAALRHVLADHVTTYLQIDRVQDLLSIPDLVRDCVVSGNYGTALDLAAMTDRLQKRYPNVRLVEQLGSDVTQSVQSMKGILLRSLREASRLPLLIKAVTYLRRVRPDNLPTVFVDSRWQFLQAQWAHIPEQLRRTQPFSFLKRFIDIYREHVYATINGFRTIFLSGADADQGRDEAVLSRFARRALGELLATLRAHAPQIEDTGDRATLWLQLAFCSQSLGRAGADFWPILDTSILSAQEWREAHERQQDMARKASRVTARQADRVAEKAA